jgi:xanthine dehydrogenase/oxidase
VRVGGGFGGKETRPPYLAAAAAVAANKLGRPVRLVLDRNTDMTMIGTRHPYKGKYWVSADPGGRIERWRTDFWANGGSTYDVTFPVSDLVVLTADGAYMVDTFGVNATCCRTNRLTRTAMRSFGVIQCSLITEDAIEQVAHALAMLPEDVRRANMYADSDREPVQWTPYGQALKYAVGRAVWDRLLTESDFYARAAAVADFNAKNRWRKRGISMIPVKYGISYTYITGNQGGALITVCESDGTVVFSTGGVEMGQGLETKLVQIAAEVLDIDMAMFRPAETSTEVVPNASSTGASTGADLNGGALKLAAREIRARLEDYCRRHEKEFPNWQTRWRELWPKIVASAYADRINLSAQALYKSPDLSEISNEQPTGSPFYYFSWSAACSEVEIDVLTGEFVLLRTDILYDAGKSLNPDLDAGQVWGGFVQGLGNVTTEQMYFAEDGRPLSDGTWNYKPPCSKTIPVDFRVTLLNYERKNPVDDLPLDPHGIQSSKSTGEPPLVLANTVFFAIKHAILAARADFGVTSWFALDSPATVERIQQACMIEDPGTP